MTRSKANGTLAESTVVRYLTERGLPNVARRTLTGSHDTGDIWVDGGACVLEVKSRKVGHTWTDIEAWLTELDREVLHADKAGAKALISALVVKRVGSGPANVGDWFVYQRPDDACYLLSGTAMLPAAGWLATTLDQWANWVLVRLADRGPYGRLG
jgi:Holliday junction resolvase